MPRKQWKYYPRWTIEVELTAATSLHIGSGETATRDQLKNAEKNAEGEPVDIPACLKDAQGKPYIPGSTIKGKVRAWLEQHIRDGNEEMIEQLFGRKTGSNSRKDQGCGGRAEFHNAVFTKELPEERGSKLPYWDQEKQTYVETCTVINRATRTVEYRKLYYPEAVPAGVGFKMTITGAMEEQHAALLAAAIAQGFIENQSDPISLGAGDAHGKGYLKWEHIKISCMDKQQVKDWLKNNNNAMAHNAMRAFNEQERKDLTRKGAEHLTTGKNTLALDIDLQFDGPFLVADPSRHKQDGPDHQPLRDSDGNPALPVKSFRGAIRSQAEKIIRTLGEKCCDTKHPCAAVYKTEEVEAKLCLACQIFGATGWKSRVIILFVAFVDAVRKEVGQDFVAIDRFHGGAKDGAKFDNRHALQPSYKTRLVLSADLPDWGKGLLALTLRDLQEGDIRFGYGRAKGYGALERERTHIIDIRTLQKDEFIVAFRQKCIEATMQYACDVRPTPEPKVQPPETVDAGQAGDFHNPYHFIPNRSAPDTPTWLKKEQFGDSMHDSHAIYRTRDGDDHPIYHGRIDCTLTTETPIFIGGKRMGGAPENIEHYTLNEETAIPASSLRGMIASLAESASNSALRVLSLDANKGALLSYRKSVNAKTDEHRPLSAIGIVTKRGEQYFLIPLALPTLEVGREAECFVPTKYRRMFPDDRANFKVYLQGECKTGTLYETWTPKKPVIHFLPLDNGIRVENALISSDSSSNLKTNRGFILGQKPIDDAHPSATPRPNQTPGILRIFGKEHRAGDALPRTKKHELFIPVPKAFVDDFEAYLATADAFEIEHSAIEQFQVLADECTRPQAKKDEKPEEYEWLPYHLKGTERNAGGMKKDEQQLCRLKTGDLVYFRPDEDGKKVAEVSLSSVWRGKVPAPAYEFFRPEHRPFNEERQTISPAELLFGFVQDSKTEDQALAFAGKVNLSAGRLQSGQANIHLEHVTLKILSSPKPPSPALYFTRYQGPRQYMAKHELSTRPQGKNGRAWAQGRKHYLHALRNDNDPQGVQKLTSTGQPTDSGDATYPWESKNTESANQKVRIKPVRKGIDFQFHVEFDNLSEWELGLLLYTLRPTEAFRHKIGMGKPLGLGSVRIDIGGLQLIDRVQRYGQDTFDDGRYNQTVDKDWTAIRGEFAQTMEPDIKRAIELMGDPEQVTKPVHYPQVAGQKIEEQTYQWFVANDIGSGKGNNKIQAAEAVLVSLDETSHCIPALKRHPWNDG